MVSENLHAALEMMCSGRAAIAPSVSMVIPEAKTFQKFEDFWDRARKSGCCHLKFRSSPEDLGKPPRLPRQDSRRRGLVRSQHKIQPENLA
jgi:hypothetical protein